MAVHEHLTPTSPDVAPSTLDRSTQRALTDAEGGFFAISTELVRGREAVGVAQTHDSRHDRLLKATVRAIDAGLSELAIDRQTRSFLRGLRRLVTEAQVADLAEDAEIGVADMRMAAAHESSKAGAGRIELALVGRSRG